MFILGLTGGIGSGKSAASAVFSSQGISVVDADVAARTVVEAGKPALEAINTHFGNDVINPDGTLDRKALRTIVFNNESERLWLEQLTHPLIRQQIQSELNAAGSSYAVLESPLLLETNQHELVSRVLVIDVPEELQLARAGTRDGSDAEQIRKIMNSQMNREARLARADDVILNNGDLASLREKVLALHQTYLELSN